MIRGIYSVIGVSNLGIVALNVKKKALSDVHEQANYEEEDTNIRGSAVLFV